MTFFGKINIFSRPY